ncbi:hypothetical protein SCP_1701880 [Sparassis crispa]|uniref:Uncharacterized protein n=1 Tax=Sparassis crispa TaxID=139825 RepID=A0A401H626_9APHY|nr:hypothetical protein SCP_1701880 [Sparassis crispa]GBE89862.1 hypothetical protein SCP_1701880 [Sparassis crispa]
MQLRARAAEAEGWITALGLETDPVPHIDEPQYLVYTSGSPSDHLYNLGPSGLRPSSQMSSLTPEPSEGHLAGGEPDEEHNDEGLNDGEGRTDNRSIDLQLQVPENHRYDSSSAEVPVSEDQPVDDALQARSDGVYLVIARVSQCDLFDTEASDSDISQAQRGIGGPRKLSDNDVHAFGEDGRWSDSDPDAFVGNHGRPNSDNGAFAEDSGLSDRDLDAHLESSDDSEERYCNTDSPAPGPPHGNNEVEFEEHYEFLKDQAEVGQLALDRAAAEVQDAVKTHENMDRALREMQRERVECAKHVYAIQDNLEEVLLKMGHYQTRLIAEHDDQKRQKLRDKIELAIHLQYKIQMKLKDAKQSLEIKVNQITGVHCQHAKAAGAVVAVCRTFEAAKEKVTMLIKELAEVELLREMRKALQLPEETLFTSGDWESSDSDSDVDALQLNDIQEDTMDNQQLSKDSGDNEDEHELHQPIAKTWKQSYPVSSDEDKSWSPSTSPEPQSAMVKRA